MVGIETYTTSYAYDGADRVTTVTYPTNEVVTQTYNGRGLPYGLSSNAPATFVSGTLYNQLGGIKQIDLGNGLSTAFNYHGLDALDTGDAMSYWGKPYRIKTFVTAAPTTERLHLKYWWDAGGNLSSRKDMLAAETETFSYDSLDRLTGASGPYTESFTYNAIGNMLSKNGVSYSYSAPGSPRPHAVTAAGGTNYGYDANGNMTARGGQTLTWDVENRVSAVTGGAGFVYDGEGQRGKKTENGETILYVNKYYEKNLTTSEVTTHYYLGSRQIALRKGTTTSYVQQDHLTGTSVISDSTGAVTGAIKYTPWGSTRSSSGAIPIR